MWWLLWTVAGCDLSRFETVSADGEIPPVEGDALLWVARSQESPMPVPAWVSGSLPRPDTLTWNERSALLGRACQGDGVLLAALVDESRAAAARGVESPWDEAWVEFCRVPARGLCAWVHTQLEPETDEAMRRMWHVAGGCLDPLSGSWVVTSDAPEVGIVDWLAAQDDQYRPVAMSLGTAAAKSVLQTHVGLHHDRALQTLASVDAPEHARLLLDHDNAQVWLYRQTEPAARAAFEAWCETEANPSWQCLESFRPLDDLQQTVSDTSVDLSSLLAAHPDHSRAIIDAIADCVRRSAVEAHPRGDRCLRALVGAGGQAELIEALDHPDSMLYTHWIPVRDQWKRFGSNDKIRAYLVENQLIPADTRVWDGTEPPADLLHWMIEADRGMWIPRTAAEAVRMIAGRVPELADLVATQREPTWFEEDSERRRYIELFVWAEGVRHRVLVPTDDSYVRQVVGLMNAIAADRRLDLRFVAVQGWHIVVWGPEKGLRTASADGFLVARDRSPDVVVDVEDTDE